jgi:hypothetical protein
MNNRLKLPDTPLIKMSYWSIVAGILLYSFITPWQDIPHETTPKPAPPIITDTFFKEARKIEMAWINNTFDLELDYLLAPVSPLPCPNNISDIPEGIRAQTQQAINTAQIGQFTQSIGLLNSLVRDESAHWLPVLTLAELYAQHNQDMVALQILERYLDANARQTLINQLRQNQDQSEDTRIYMVHLLYMNALLRLKTQQYHSDHLLWGGLKYPLKFSKQLGLIPTSNKQPIQTPGCSYDANDLTTYALYNNLIVGYLKTQNFIASQSLWQNECKRKYGAPPLNKNPLFPILDDLCSGNRKMETYWEWTISNAESLLTMAPTPQDSLLSFNLMLLIDSLIQRGDQVANQDVQQALSQKKEEMLNHSLSEWESAPEGYKQILGPSLAKSATSIAVNQGGNIPTNLELYQTDEQASKVIKAIRLTVSIRNGDPIQWLTTRRGEIKQTLEKRADEWLNAMDKYITNHPPEKGQLNKVKLIGIWLSYNKNKLAILFSIIPILLLGKWTEKQIREGKALFTSFYGQEWEMINAAAHNKRRQT